MTYSIIISPQCRRVFARIEISAGEIGERNAEPDGVVRRPGAGVTDRSGDVGVLVSEEVTRDVAEGKRGVWHRAARRGLRES